MSEGLAVEGVLDGVPGSVGSGGASVGLSTLAVLERLTTKGALVDLALLGSGEGNTEVLELDDGVGRLSAHVVNSVLVAEPVGTLDGVVHMPSPVVLGHVAKSSVDTTLSGDSVGSGGEELCDAGGVEAGLCETEGGSQAGTTGADDDGIVLVVDDRVLAGDDGRSFFSP